MAQPTSSSLRSNPTPPTITSSRLSSQPKTVQGTITTDPVAIELSTGRGAAVEAKRVPVRLAQGEKKAFKFQLEAKPRSETYTLLPVSDDGSVAGLPFIHFPRKELEAPT